MREKKKRHQEARRLQRYLHLVQDEGWSSDDTGWSLHSVTAAARKSAQSWWAPAVDPFVVWAGCGPSQRASCQRVFPSGVTKASLVPQLTILKAVEGATRLRAIEPTHPCLSHSQHHGRCNLTFYGRYLPDIHPRETALDDTETPSLSLSVRHLYSTSALSRLLCSFAQKKQEGHFRSVECCAGVAFSQSIDPMLEGDWKPSPLSGVSLWLRIAIHMGNREKPQS